MRHFRVGTFVLMALFLSATACPVGADDSVALAQRALQLQQNGDYAAAADTYRTYLKLSPGEGGAHSNLGTVLIKLGRYEEAINEYAAAQKLLPGDRRIGLNLALAYSKSGQVSEACRRFDALHSLEPPEKQIALLAADCHLQLGEYNRVIEILRPLERDYSSDLGIAYMLGTAFIRERRVEEGEALLDRILRNGDSAESRFLVGTQSFESGDYPAAVKHFSSAVDLNSSLPELQSFYGRALLNTGDPDAAAAAFRKELAENPNDYASNLGLGQILTFRKNFKDATLLLERALLLRPKSPEAMLALGECWSAMGRLPEARERLEAVAQSLPNSLEAHRELASVYARLHFVSDAARELDTVKKLQKQANASAAGPMINDLAPDFELPDAAATKTVRLRDFRGKNPVVLVFGSYTCPNFRSAASALKSMYDRFGGQVPFLLVYIREAHATDNWQSTQNGRDGIAVSPANTIKEKQDHAAMCSLRLHLPFPALVDGMEGSVEAAYSAWPSRVFLIGADGRIQYSTRLSELEFRAEDMESALRKAIAASKPYRKNAAGG